MICTAMIYFGETVGFPESFDFARSTLRVSPLLRRSGTAMLILDLGENLDIYTSLPPRVRDSLCIVGDTTDEDDEGTFFWPVS